VQVSATGVIAKVANPASSVTNRFVFICSSFG
jgi:hypothetical protein